jgi:hypothetical protein
MPPRPTPTINDEIITANKPQRVAAADAALWSGAVIA